MAVPVTLDQIPAYLRKRVGLWAQITGKSADELLRGFQFEILLLESILGRIGGVSELQQPLLQPGQPGTQIPTSPFQSVDLTINETISTNSSFGYFIAPFDGVSILSISLSNGGVLSVVEQRQSGQTSDPMVLYGGTKLNAGQLYDIPVGITVGNKYRFQSDTGGSATWQVVSYNIPVALFPFTGSSSGGGTTGVVATDILLSTTTATTVLSYTVGTSNEALEAALDLSVITGPTVMTVVLSWDDPNNGPSTFYWEDGGSVPVGPHGYDVYPFTAAANSTVTIVATAGSNNQVYVTASIEKQV